MKRILFPLRFARDRQFDAADREAILQLCRNWGTIPLDSTGHASGRRSTDGGTGEGGTGPAFCG